MEKIFTDANFQEAIDSGKPVVIDFSATWCGPCKAIAPIIDELANTYENKVIVGKCDIEENMELAGKFGIRNVPTILFLRDGKVVDKQVGAAAKSVFEKKIEKLINE